MERSRDRARPGMIANGQRQGGWQMRTPRMAIANKTLSPEAREKNRFVRGAGGS